MAMKRSRKIALVVLAALVLVVVVSVVLQRQKAGVVEVQADTVGRKDLSAVVTASGEIRPRHYVNINSQSFGKIVAILVEEGDRVKKGQVLLRLEAVQPAAEVEAQRALVKSGEAAVEAAEASLKTAQAEVQRSRADFQRARLNWDRAQGLHEDELISQQEYDTRQAEFESARAAVQLAEARVSQARAELDRSHSNLLQARATLRRVSDVLQKTIYASPIDGVVTNLPVNAGEHMVPGIQNSPGSFLMTVADMAEVTAEVKVDETDIVNVRLGQAAEITIDAYPNRTFAGKVTEVGTTAIVRSTGQSTAQLQTGTQEAKDFKVVVTLEDPPEIVRPGLSTTSRITTATRENVLAIPIQALTIRRREDIDAAARRAQGEETAEAASVTAAEDKEKEPGEGEDKDKEKEEELQGVFVIEEDQAHFREVETGITGVTEIEITDGLKGDERIVTGSYRVLRELRHLARVRVEKAEEKEGE